MEPNAQGCTFAHPLFEPQVKKMKVLRTHFFGRQVVLRTHFWIASSAPGTITGPPEGQKNWESYSTPNLYLNQQILGELKYLNWQIFGVLYTEGLFMQILFKSIVGHPWGQLRVSKDVEKCKEFEFVELLLYFQLRIE